MMNVFELTYYYNYNNNPIFLDVVSSYKRALEIVDFHMSHYIYKTETIIIKMFELDSLKYDVGKVVGIVKMPYTDNILLSDKIDSFIKDMNHNNPTTRMYDKSVVYAVKENDRTVSISTAPNIAFSIAKNILKDDNPSKYSDISDLSVTVTRHILNGIDIND